MWPLRSRRGYGRQNMGVMLLVLQLMQTGLDRIPPVTLGTVALNVGIYLGVVHQFLKQRLPSSREVCIGVGSVWYRQDYSRLLKGAFFHADDWHLYYNMASFLYKGIQIERKVGSVWFLYMLATFTACTNVLLLYLNYLAALFFNDESYLWDCAVGFSGVIFAVKVVTTHMSPRGTSLIMGFIPVNSRIACWFELALIQILVPNASFTGHLAGILVGLAYVKGPLHAIMKIVPNMLGLNNRVRYRSGPSYTYTAGTAGATVNGGANRSDHYARYTGGLDEDEQLRTAMRESMEENHEYERVYPDLHSNVEPTAPPEEPPPPGWNIPADPHHDEDEVRRRRLQRFDNR